MLLGKGVLKICNKFTGEHICRRVILIKLQGNFIEIKLRHGLSPVNLLHIFRTTFSKNTSGGLLLDSVVERRNSELYTHKYKCHTQITQPWRRDRQGHIIWKTKKASQKLNTLTGITPYINI